MNGRLSMSIFSYFSIPNIASDQMNIRRNADFIIAMLKKRGVDAKLVGAGCESCGFWRNPGSGRDPTLVFYAHYDGQPLDRKEWAPPPFTRCFSGMA